MAPKPFDMLAYRENTIQQLVELGFEGHAEASGEWEARMSTEALADALARLQIDFANGKPMPTPINPGPR